MEAVEEEVEAVEAQAAAVEEALGVLEPAADMETEAGDPAPWGTDRTWTAVEADQRLTAGYEKLEEWAEKGKTFGKPESAWVTSFYSPVGLLANPLASLLVKQIKWLL